MLQFHNFEIQNASSPTNNAALEALKMLFALNPNVLQNNSFKSINGDSNDLLIEINRLNKVIEDKNNQLKEKKGKQFLIL